MPFEIKFFNSRYSGIQQFANCQIFLLNLNLKKSILVSKFYKMFRNSAEHQHGIILLSFFLPTWQRKGNSILQHEVHKENPAAKGDAR